jgi:hypothetical protein
MIYFSSCKFVLLYSYFSDHLTFRSISTYVPLMQACLTCSHVSGSATTAATMLDHRYFYLESGYGRYTYGLAR